MEAVTKPFVDDDAGYLVWLREHRCQQRSKTDPFSPVEN
jgi:hypothetical protein